MKIFFLLLICLPIKVSSQVVTEISYTKSNVMVSEGLDTTNNTASNGYFSWEHTGNVKIDAENIELAAREFKEKYPLIYNAICCDTGVLKIPYQEFQLMDEKKQQLIISNPKKFIIQSKE